MNNSGQAPQCTSLSDWEGVTRRAQQAVLEGHVFYPPAEPQDAGLQLGVVM